MDKISKSELKILKASFSLFEKNEDGKVTLEEIKQGSEKLIKEFRDELLVMFDRNGDGTVSLEEYIKNWIDLKASLLEMCENLPK